MIFLSNDFHAGDGFIHAIGPNATGPNKLLHSASFYMASQFNTVDGHLVFLRLSRVSPKLQVSARLSLCRRRNGVVDL